MQSEGRTFMVCLPLSGPISQVHSPSRRWRHSTCAALNHPRGLGRDAPLRRLEREGRTRARRCLKRVFSSYLLNPLERNFLPQPLTLLNSVSLTLISRSAWQRTSQSESTGTDEKIASSKRWRICRAQNLS